jgi:molybdenum cofactor guanylyltransferase
MNMPPITGLILAGGQGTRMGGADKALQILHGKALLAHVAGRLLPQVDELLVSAARADAYPEFTTALKARIITDELAGAGPLAGVHAGLKAACNELLVTAPCDAPFLPADLVARLFAALNTGSADLTLARTVDGRHPVFALMRRSVLPVLTQYLTAGGRKADGWYQGLKIIEVAFDDAKAFTNINTRAELARWNAVAEAPAA